MRPDPASWHNAHKSTKTASILSNEKSSLYRASCIFPRFGGHFGWSQSRTCRHQRRLFELSRLHLANTSTLLLFKKAYHLMVASCLLLYLCMHNQPYTPYSREDCHNFPFSARDPATHPCPFSYLGRSSSQGNPGQSESLASSSLAWPGESPQSLWKWRLASPNAKDIEVLVQPFSSLESQRTSLPKLCNAQYGPTETLMTAGD
jgi:hypothetical protein